MVILKFLWYSIRPLSKLESAVGWLDIGNILVHILWGGGAGYLVTNWDWFHAEYLWAIPAILFLIAGIKLQVKLDSFKSAYKYALSLDNVEIVYDPKPSQLRMLLRLSNTLDKPLEYKVDTTKTYIELEGRTTTFLANVEIGTVIPRLKSSTIYLPSLPLPVTNPSIVKLHYELLYGLPGKPLFRQVKDLELSIKQVNISPNRISVNLNYIYKFEDDEPIKKRGSGKKG